MEYKQRAYPQFSACGLNCGLCPRYHTVGSSRCPGCAGEGFSDVHPSCGVLSCSQRKGLQVCFQCEEFPCSRYDGAAQYDSFVTHRNQLRDLGRAKENGMRAYKAELEEKIRILEQLFQLYDDGRRKSYFCLAVNLLDLSDLKTVMVSLSGEARSAQSRKEKAAVAVRLFEILADDRGIALELRKKGE